MICQGCEDSPFSCQGTRYGAFTLYSVGKTSLILPIYQKCHAGRQLTCMTLVLLKNIETIFETFYLRLISLRQNL